MTNKAGQTIVKCPKCGNEFPLTDALLEPLRMELQNGFREEYDEKLKEAQENLEIQARRRAEEDAIQTVKDLQAQVKETNERLQKSQEIELTLRKKGRELEKKQEETELELIKRIDEERKQIKDELEKGYSLKVRQQEDQIASMKSTIDDLQRKAEQTSQQAKGKALEGKLQDILMECFPDDEVEPVPTGMRGADILQRVNGKTGKCCGIIIWESKNTRNWSNGWLDKLKENQRSSSAEVAVIASRVLPDEIEHFGLLHGVWVTDWLFASQLASALRITLIQLTESKIAYEGRGHKIELMYDYLTSTQFKQRIETIVDAFTRMSEDLAQEKRATLRAWSKREKQLELVMQGTAGFYGDIQGIAGAVIPEIEALLMPYQLESGNAD